MWADLHSIFYFEVLSTPYVIPPLSTAPVYTSNIFLLSICSYLSVIGAKLMVLTITRRCSSSMSQKTGKNKFSKLRMRCFTANIIMCLLKLNYHPCQNFDLASCEYPRIWTYTWHKYNKNYLVSVYMWTALSCLMITICILIYNMYILSNNITFIFTFGQALK